MPIWALRVFLMDSRVMKVRKTLKIHEITLSTKILCVLGEKML